MWIETEKDLGEVKVGEKVKIEYEYDGDIQILQYKVSCGCTEPEVKGNKVILNYKAEEIPVHLEHKGSFITTKRIWLNTSEGGFTLSFKVKVIS